MLPVAPDLHCAKAGEAPNATTMPVASASPRKVPPASALLPSNAARQQRFCASGANSAAILILFLLPSVESILDIAAPRWMQHQIIPPRAHASAGAISRRAIGGFSLDVSNWTHWSRRHPLRQQRALQSQVRKLMRHGSNLEVEVDSDASHGSFRPACSTVPATSGFSFDDFRSIEPSQPAAASSSAERRAGRLLRDDHYDDGTMMMGSR